MLVTSNSDVCHNARRLFVFWRPVWFKFRQKNITIGLYKRQKSYVGISEIVATFTTD